MLYPSLFSATVLCFDTITVWVSSSSHHTLDLPTWAHKRGRKGQARCWIRTVGTCRSQRGCGAGGMPGLSSTTHGEGASPGHGSSTASMAISLVAISLVAINLPAISLQASSSREAARAPCWALSEPFFPVLTWLLFI